MKTVFFTIIGDSHYTGCRTDEFVASFKHFHPNIDLVLFRQKEIDETFKSNPGLNFYNAKATFAKKLYNHYDLVVCIDADHLIFSELTEILKGDYDVAGPSNYNVWFNAGIEMGSICTQGLLSRTRLIPFEKYINGGIIASTSKEFWDYYDYASIKFSSLLRHADNDILNLLCHLLPYKVKILEGHFEYNHPSFTCYYGCSSLGRERQIIVNNNRLELDGKPVKAYHFARGGQNKIHPTQIFSTEVCDFIYLTMINHPKTIEEYKVYCEKKKKRESVFGRLA